MPGVQFSGGGVQADPRVEQAISRAPRPPSTPALNVADPGAAAQRTGQALQRIGDAQARAELEAAQRVNATRINAALNQALEIEMRLAYDKDVGYTNQRGISALERQSGKPLAEEYAETYGKEIERIAGTLGNEFQRTAFMDASTKRLAQFRASAMKHESDEFRTYSLSVNDGVITNRMNLIGFNYSNPKVVDGAVQSIRAATYESAQLLGKSAEWAQAQSAKAVSDAHKLALATAVEKNDITYADAYLRRYGKDMEPDDLLQAQGLITKEMDLRVATSAAAEVIERATPRIVPGDFDRLANIVMGIESGGRRYGEDGALLESSKGAKGEMQVLDTTNRDPGFGVRPAADDSPEERARVGRDYLGALLKHYGGDVPKALAAYNWGPGKLDDAINEHGEGWLDHAPAETQRYVERGAREFGAGGGAVRATLADLKAELRERPDLANNPSRMKQAETALESRYKDIEAAKRQTEDDALDAAYRGLYENGGRLDALPPSVRRMIPGDKLGSVMVFAEKMAKNGGAVHRPEAWATILSLPRSELAKMTPLQFFQQFRPVLDDQHLEKGYALLADAQGAAGDKHLEVITTANRVKRAAEGAGILPADGKPNDGEKLAFAQFEQVIDERVREFERTDLAGKRKANSEELQRIIDNTLADQAFVPRFLLTDRQRPIALMAPEQQGRAYVRVGGEEVPLSAIPAGQRLTIAGKLQSRDLPVTEQRIAELWVAAGRPQ
ncbi:hypothetical protein E6O51_03100 [Pseudothauera rhizosphaerae]|uniref:Transglycosylase SLT domain-containing protein n=2 Tax=Pseudothauera rhizosphaerae TaxID=2565932 RepID=A0A4S4AWP5_9RHOO|nr:hypothetical protein E6O51_03100 [Pseudothauera rhizosphaerae]